MTDTQKQALYKAASFCAYQERTIKEVRQRMAEWELSEQDMGVVLAELMAQNYLNETRFAKAFAGGKFRIKKWGKLKIKQELKMRGLSNELIQKGLQEIDGDQYEATLHDLIQKKAHALRGNTPLAMKQKLLRFALSRGFESDLTWDAINTLGL
ncbi:MAG: RecX family transcriptional regulator [Runella slithyformis]|nr:MAG: RecX family transcriptional regulator [Runella slithyformis]TAE95273.1 MAG: RecX family transcriptional regulator [Runella slithyformis]TAF28954.1 MAG: RecX family transcriptional regulator [Runella slithyformis]TAF48008.1 MAG: RecX family transcriptional regulator [Runella slithyformis]TAF82493.1 MAG: RecX family transcriptional regulator [Runella slithyformis]